MPRPIQYSEEEVLDRALAVFWRSGYAACSMQMLVDATGMNRQSIYNVFGDKDGMFYDVLAHYKSKVALQCRALNHLAADLTALRAFIRESLITQQNMGPGACFIVITAYSPQAQDPHIRPALLEGAKMVRDAFQTVLAREAADGRLSKALTPEGAAAHLYSMMNGLSALAQTGGNDAQIEAALDLTFEALTLQKDC